MNRETWLNELAALMAPRFVELGFPVPKFRVAVGWTSAGKSTKVWGECWHSSASADQAFEILIAPIIDDSMATAATLAHELAHAAVGFEHRHGGAFKQVALALGLLPPMTATSPGPEFIAWVQPFLDQLGAIPHAKVILERDLPPIPRPPRPPREDGEAEDVDEAPPPHPSSNAKPKQSTRLLKAMCCADEGEGDPCGYTARLTRKWLEKLGAPHCPAHGDKMQMEGEGADNAE